MVIRNCKFHVLLLWPLFSVMTSGAQSTQKDTAVREIILVFKTHFDIGYTDFAEAVVQKYSTSMIQHALEVVDKNKALDANRKFVWTVSGWPMQQILQRSEPEIATRVKQMLSNGNFAVHALPFSIQTESADPEMLVRGMNISSGLVRNAGLPLPRDAKMSDVPSHSWILPTLLTHAGVKMLHIGCNPASQSPQLPLLFWWQGPDSSRLMTMYWAKNYGTSLLPPPGWPCKTWLALMQTNDNDGPPSPEEVDRIIADAHKLAPNARVRVGRISDFYDAVMKENPQLPVVKGDMPDTWIHGFMSMPREVKSNRKISADLFTWQSLNTLYHLWTSKGYSINTPLQKAYDNNLLFNEHTFGMAMSHAGSGVWAYGDAFEQMRAQGVYDDIETSWKEKSNRVFTAENTVTPYLNRVLRELAQEPGVNGKRIFVYNPLPWTRGGLVTLHASSDWNPGNAVKDIATGEIIPVSNKNNVIQFIAKDIPASGYRNYQLIKQDAPMGTALSMNETTHTIENKYFRIQLDTEHGAIASMLDKNSGRELVDRNSGYGFGQYVYERFSKQDADDYTASYVKAFHQEWADAELGRPALTPGPHITVKGGHARTVFSSSPVSVSATMFFEPDANVQHRYSITATLYENSPELELIWSINGKPAEPWPEAGWISFPLNVSHPSFRLGRLGGITDPATDFVKGSNLDYGFLNTGMAVIDDKGAGVSLFSPDAPGVSLGRTGLWKYSSDYVPHQPNVFINLYNNLWSTNFTEWIEGSWSARIYLRSTTHYDNESAVITPAEEYRYPLKAVLVNNKGGKLPVVSSGVQLSMKGVMVTAFAENPDGTGTVLRLWEQAGNSGKCTITLPPHHPFKTACYCDLRGTPLGKPFAVNEKMEVNISAYAPLSILLK
ncbi:glycoside hydrolase family 38 N-terminal domain-containing protein [Chitinophaga flava]|uniref:Glycoside hydrolase family 38 N-terminal domain-containing protein n=1 Tax=Chitinophaga flava TaxID=2259036 RepID=A0A365XUR9_9BACT|nr:glycoside hydrolase family 38 C-terminal domain-containing protein [Chitinophaga flava]RBL90107.1 hypothetical protein DF182_26935 [Chitinophaga flava]